MTIPTLDGLSVEQLRDLAKRASVTADQKQQAKDEKDLVPPVGTEWEYNGRYWVTEKAADNEVMTLSIPKKGGPIVLHWFGQGRFSRPFSSSPVYRGMDVVRRSPGVIAKLALRVRDA